MTKVSKEIQFIETSDVLYFFKEQDLEWTSMNRKNAEIIEVFPDGRIELIARDKYNATHIMLYPSAIRKVEYVFNENEDEKP